MNMPPTVHGALAALKDAKCPEDIFGDDPDDIAGWWRSWAQIVHEDRVRVEHKAVAHEAFLLLTKIYDEAKAKVANKTFGDRKPLIMAVLKTKTAAYSLYSLISKGDIADIYRGTSDSGIEVLVKVGRSPANNDLMKNEADILTSVLKATDPKLYAYFPTLVDSFEMEDVGKTRKRVNVFEYIPDTVSLDDVNKSYPDGIEAADAAWMWNRMLESLHLLHEQGYIHGAVTPDRFLIVPETHRGILIDFCYAVKTGSLVKAISPKWKKNYPEEILSKKSVDNSTDVYMASYCMNHILGGIGQNVPSKTPMQIKGLLKASWLGKAHRIQDVYELHEDFNKVLRKLFGPKKFRHFQMPVMA